MWTSSSSSLVQPRPRSSLRSMDSTPWSHMSLQMGRTCATRRLSRLWQEACAKELYKVDNAEFVGAFGAVDLDGFPIIKTYGFLLNCPKIARALDRRLSPQERQVCKPLEGANVTSSQVYPDDLVHAILRALRKTAQLLSPGVLMKLHRCLLALPNLWTTMMPGDNS